MNMGRFDQKSCKMPVASADTFADGHVILSFCHSFILHVMEGGARQTGRRAEKSNGAADEWPC
jgi:hypothetical protein